MAYDGHADVAYGRIDWIWDHSPWLYVLRLTDRCSTMDMMAQVDIKEMKLPVFFLDVSFFVDYHMSVCSFNTN